MIPAAVRLESSERSWRLRATQSASRRHRVAAGAAVAVVLAASAAGAQVSGGAPMPGSRWIDAGRCGLSQGRGTAGERRSTPPSLVGAVAVVTHWAGAEREAACGVAACTLREDRGDQSRSELVGGRRGCEPAATEKSAVLDLIAELEATQAKRRGRAVKLSDGDGKSADAAKALLAWGDSTTSAGAAAASTGCSSAGRSTTRLVPISPTESFCIDDPDGSQDERALRRAARRRGVRRAGRARTTRTPYPGEDGVGALADQQCGTEFQSFVGIAVEDSVLRLHAVHPQRGAVELG